MEPKYGQKWGLQQASKDDMVDLCDMLSTYRIILFKDMRFMLVSGLTPARNINASQWDGKGIILTREQAIKDYPNYFFKSSDSYRKLDYREKYPTSGFSLSKDTIEYLKTKKNKSAYVEKLISMERDGIIKVD